MTQNIRDLRKGDSLTVTIERWNNDWHGQARVDKKRVVVPGTLPGETVRGTIRAFWRRGLLLQLDEVLQPAPERVQPACQHFGTCAGCQFQHVDYGAQLALKVERLKRYFADVGIEDRLPPIEVMPSPEPYGYRNAIKLHGPGEPGFWQVRGVDMLRNAECSICMDGIEAALSEQRRDGFKTFLEAGIDNVLFRASNTGEVFVASDQPPEGEQTPPVVHEQVTNPLTGAVETFEVPARGFWQANVHLLDTFVAAALQPVADFGPETLIEPYSGVGLFGLLGARRIPRVVGIEENPLTAGAANRNARIMGLENYQAITGRTEDNLMAYLINVDLETTALLVDPPRSGLDKDVIRLIRQHPPKRMVYVSCGPATLAANLLKLTKVYRIASMQFLDMFPQTRHMETVSVLVRD